MPRKSRQRKPSRPLLQPRSWWFDDPLRITNERLVQLRADMMARKTQSKRVMLRRENDDLPASVEAQQETRDYVNEALPLARLYRISAAAVQLASKMKDRQEIPESFFPENLPSPVGFAWLDEPIDQIRAFLWHYIDSACWIYPMTQPNFVESKSLINLAGPLAPLGVTSVPFPEIGGYDSWREPAKITLAMWSLMESDIFESLPQPASCNMGSKSERRIKRGTVHVVQLGRRNRSDSDRARMVDWSCTWLVRGHWRHYQSGRKTWIKSYLKGPDGKPFRWSDAVYKLG